MDKKENNQNKQELINEPELKEKAGVFHKKLERHLKNEYLYISERKESVESELLHLKFELQQKDKKLFNITERKDTRKYFSPLNLSDIEENQKDDKMKQISSNIKCLENEINHYNFQLEEIKELISEMEIIMNSDIFNK